MPNNYYRKSKGWVHASFKAVRKHVQILTYIMENNKKSKFSKVNNNEYKLSNNTH